jgi:hypothetical protein
MTTRVLCALTLAAAAFAATPAHAAPSSPVTVEITDDTIGVHSRYGSQPLLNVDVNRHSGRACAGFSEQLPVCTPPVLDAIHH